MNRAAQFKKVTHVIFDLDGVLLDSELIYKRAIESIAKRFGKVYTNEIRGKVIGTVERESSRIAVTEMKIPMSVDNFQTEFRTKAHSQLHNVPLMPGAEKLARHLHKNKIPIAIATSSAEKSYLLKSAKHKDFFSIFSHVVCGGTDPDVREGKPKPDIFLVCASRFPDKPHPEKCLVFEDSPNGVAAAISAGMQAVMLPDENVPENLRTAATIVVTALDATPLERFGLPALHS